MIAILKLNSDRELFIISGKMFESEKDGNDSMTANGSLGLGISRIEKTNTPLCKINKKNKMEE